MSKDTRLEAIKQKSKSPEIQRALALVASKHVTPERLTHLFAAALAGSPKLLECTPTSLLMCLMRCSEVGLEPGGLAHIVPFHTKGVYIAQLILDYKGKVEIARRTGLVRDVVSSIVKKNDEFSIELGTSHSVIHKPVVSGDRGPTIGAYAFFVYNDGYKGPAEYLQLDELLRIQSLSKSKSQEVYREHPDEMHRKAAIHRACKHGPQSPEMAASDDIERRSFQGIPQWSSAAIELGAIEASPLEADEANQDADDDAGSSSEIKTSKTDKLAEKLSGKVDLAKIDQLEQLRYDLGLRLSKFDLTQLAEWEGKAGCKESTLVDINDSARLNELTLLAVNIAKR